MSYEMHKVCHSNKVLKNGSFLAEFGKMFYLNLAACKFIGNESS